MKSEPTPKQVFLSYARRDKSIAEALAKELKRQKIKVWFEKKISSGEDWSVEISKALKESDFMIAILNEHSFSSSYVRNELEYAIFDDRYKNRLLPVLIGIAPDTDFVRLPWVLTKIPYLKITEEQSTESIAKAISRKFNSLLKIQGGEK